MDQEQATGSVNRPTALPRPTRLPVLTSNTSRLPLPKQHISSVEPPKSSLGSTSLRKKSSISTFAPTRQSTPKQSLSTRTNGPNHVPKSSTGRTSSRAASLVKPALRAGQHPPTSTPSKPVPKPEDEETHDQLSSLDSFRSASRQSSHDEPIPPLPFLPGPGESEELPEPATERGSRSSRPSLCDRTIESIQNIPATPKDRRRSSFFSPTESPMGPPPRPNSSLSRNGSNGGSRPNTSDGNSATPSTKLPSTARKVSSSVKPSSRSSTGGLGIPSANSSRRSLSGTFRAEAPGSTNPIPASPRSVSNTKRLAASTKADGVTGTRVAPVSKTMAARPVKARPSLSDAFGPAVRGDSNRREIATSKRVVSTPVDEPKQSDTTASKNSSAALRQQIAAAKAAARKEKAKHDSPQSASMSNDNALGAESHANPFNQAPMDEKHMLRNRINIARTDGRLNIAAMKLKQIPDEVLHMYDAAAMEESRVSWAEVVDLTRFIAADNEMEELPETIFPDRSVEAYDLDHETEGSLFAGLEMLDLHANMIPSVPIGLRRLQRLTSLNLSHNKLENSSLDVISQIATLRDLKLGHNGLSGSLASSICQLSHLESLDVRSNRLLGLPDAMRELVSLRVLNVSGNQLTALPMDALQEMRLSELDASNNGLIASLFPVGGPGAHPTLQSLNVANNSLAALTFDDHLDLPHLHTLDVTCNNFTALPPVSSWRELVTLLAGENKIVELPEGFTALPRLRNVNLAGNEIRTLDPEIGGMESLDSLILASNPLRDKKFLTMNASDIKRNLRARLEPAERNEDIPSEQSTDQSIAGAQSTASPHWVLKAQDTLDLSGKFHRDDLNDDLANFLANNAVKRLCLQSNTLTAFPLAVELATSLRSLDLSNNPFNPTSYLSAPLDLPSLEDLNLNRTNLTTLEPLITHLNAPRLHSLNLTANRLTGPLPALRGPFPALATLMMSENRIRSISADVLRGLRTVNLADNDIEQLPAEIGLLWDEGLRSLEVGRNAFRVPGYRVLEKGTESTMRWLRGKLPGGEEGAG